MKKDITLINRLKKEITRLEQVQSLNLEKEWEKLRSYEKEILENHVQFS